MATALEPDTYSPPLKLRLREVWRQSWPTLLFTVPALLVALYVAWHNGLHFSTYLMAGLVVVGLALTAWAVRDTYQRGVVQYDLHGMTFRFYDDRYYVPPEKLERWLVDHVWSKFTVMVGGMEKARDLTRGVLVTLETQWPMENVKFKDNQIQFRESDGQVKHKQVLGSSRLYRNWSRVHAPHVLDPGVMGYELAMQAAHELVQFDREQDYIDWLKDKGVL